MTIASMNAAAKSGQFCLVLDYDNGKVRSVSVYASQDYVFSEVYGVIDLMKDTYGMANKDPQNHDLIHQEMATLSGDNVEKTMSGSRHFHWVVLSNHEFTTSNGWATFLRLLCKKWGWKLKAIGHMFV